MAQVNFDSKEVCNITNDLKWMGVPQPVGHEMSGGTVEEEKEWISNVIELVVSSYENCIKGFYLIDGVVSFVSYNRTDLTIWLGEEDIKKLKGKCGDRVARELQEAPNHRYYGLKDENRYNSREE